MRSARSLKYLAVFILPLTMVFSFSSYGFWAWFPVVLAFGIIPALELLFAPSEENMSIVEEELVRKDRTYDYIIYLSVIYQYGFLAYFLFTINDPQASVADIMGRATSMGIMCGVIGINVAHELGHRPTKYEQFMAKMLLLSSLYMHFFIEHNRGHHKNVSTATDPASSRKNEMLYVFWVRSVVFSYISAWKIENNRLRRKGFAAFSWRNEMLWYQVIQLALIGAILQFFGWFPMLAFLYAATVGFLLLETVNYIEHYGLRRKKVSEHRFEGVRPHHSWNSNHPIGRILLFELSRHSDHHFEPHRPYQVLKHHEESPQMPTGYPGMMLLSTIPPLWFWVMNRRIEQEANKVEGKLSTA